MKCQRQFAWNVKYYFLGKIFKNVRIIFQNYYPGPSCSRLTTSLVNDSLNLQLSDTQICWNFLLKKCCSAKATHIFSAKNIRILYIESIKIVNEMTLNKLVKLTTLWTTGPSMLNNTLTIKVLSKIVVVVLIYFCICVFCFFFKENKAWHFLWIVCLVQIGLHISTVWWRSPSIHWFYKWVLKASIRLNRFTGEEKYPDAYFSYFSLRRHTFSYFSVKTYIFKFLCENTFSYFSEKTYILIFFLCENIHFHIFLCENIYFHISLWKHTFSYLSLKTYIFILLCENIHFNICL